MFKKYFPTTQHFVLLVIGIFFMFSGLIKLNDPVGFSLKIEAYLRSFAKDIHPLFLQFLPYTLLIAITICLLEVLLGLALVGRFRIRLVLLALIGLTIFFTILTGYTVWFKRIDSCGCLSEAIPLTPLQSLLKNMVLLSLLSWLAQKNSSLSHDNPSFIHIGLFSLTILCSLGLGLYTWRHLPIIDFGHYRVGTYIPHLTQPQKPLRYQYWLEKNGKTTISEAYPVNEDYELVKTTLLNPTDGPLVTNFTIWNEEQEITQELLQGNQLICIVKLPQRLDAQTYALLQAYIQESTQPINMLFLLPFHQSKEGLPSQARSRVGWGSADLLQSMIRSDVGFMLLQHGTVKGKWAATNLPSLHKALLQLR
jgi:hypothetical protein